MALISSKQIDFSYGISGILDMTGSINISGSLTLLGDASASVAYLSSSGDIYGDTGSFNYLAVTGDLAVDDISADTGSFVQLNVSGESNFTGAITSSGDIRINNASSQSLMIGTAGQTMRLGSWNNSSNPDIGSLLTGTLYGSLIQGENTGHIVIGIRDNQVNDSFAIVAGNGSMLATNKYSKLAFRVDAEGNTTVGGNTAITGSLNVSGDFIVDDITSDTGSFGYIDMSGNIKTDLTASSFIFVDSDQNLNEVTPTDGQLFIYTGSQFVASNILDGGSY